MPVWYAQEHPTSCVAACVRMVLTDFAERWTEGQVHALLGRPRQGITLTATYTRLVQAGATATLEKDWNLDDVRDASVSLRLWVSNVTLSGIRQLLTPSLLFTSPVNGCRYLIRWRDHNRGSMARARSS